MERHKQTNKSTTKENYTRIFQNGVNFLNENEIKIASDHNKTHKTTMVSKFLRFGGVHFRTVKTNFSVQVYSGKIRTSH